MEKLIFRNLNIKFGEKGEGYFVEDECARIYLTADDIDRISTAVRFNFIEKLKADDSLKAKETGGAGLI